MKATALIAEDEPLLAENLQAELARLWPALEVLANVRNGQTALEQSLALRPELVLLDIRMPGLSGLEVAQALAEDWDASIPLPLIAFVTAYDQYAIQAFELAAVDYVLKPVQSDRLAQTCTRFKAALEARRSVKSIPEDFAATIDKLRSLITAGRTDAVEAAPPLTVIQASIGAAIHMVPINDVLYFEAADKYVRVITAAREYLIRLSLRQLLPQLDRQRFWQIHRGTVVRVDAIATARRDDSGKVYLALHEHPEQLVVSRLFAHQFKGM